MTWSELADWWRSEIENDSAYAEVVTPLLLEVLLPEPNRLYLDIGCGEGRVMRAVQAEGGVTHGIDLNSNLLAGLAGVVVARLPQIPMQTATYDGVYCVLTLEHIEDHATLFAEASRIVKPGGVLALVMNHPTWTAPESTPITDDDGEILWRPGEYFSDGFTTVTTADGEVTFYHRPMSQILNAAARSGLHLEMMIEQPHHELTDQPGIPRLLACRWTRSNGP